MKHGGLPEVDPIDDMGTSPLRKTSENGKNMKIQECIPVWCVPPAAVAISPATHIHPPPLAMHAFPTMHAPCHTQPLPCILPCHSSLEAPGPVDNSLLFTVLQAFAWCKTLTDPGGGARYVPSLCPISFSFVQFSTKILPNNRLAYPPLGLSHPLPWEILDLPMHRY